MLQIEIGILITAITLICGVVWKFSKVETRLSQIAEDMTKKVDCNFCENRKESVYAEISTIKIDLQEDKRIQQALFRKIDELTLSVNKVVTIMDMIAKNIKVEITSEK